MALEGKVALVTGGSRGIGRAISQGLAGAGARVVVSGRTEVDTSTGTPFERYGSGTIHDTARVIAEAGGEATAIKCDVTIPEDVHGLIERTVAHYGRIDIVVSNAGIDCEAPVPELDVDLLDRCLAVNVRGPLLLCKYALPIMIAQSSGGSIFGITSGAARGYRPGRVGYSMSKAALERMFVNLAEEVRPHNIAVNVLSPGRGGYLDEPKWRLAGHRPHSNGATRCRGPGRHLAGRTECGLLQRAIGRTGRVRHFLGAWDRP